MFEIGDECLWYDDECPRYDDECPWYDDECRNSMTTSIVDQSTYNSTQYFDSPIKFQDRGKAEALSRTEIMEDCVDFANCRTLYYDTRYGSLHKKAQQEFVQSLYLL